MNYKNNQEEQKVEDLGKRNLSAKRRVESSQDLNLSRKEHFEDKFR